MRSGGRATTLFILLILLPLVHATPISTCEELQNISLDLTASYFLTQNIDCSDTPNWNGGAGFLPVGQGYFTDAFRGELNGNGNTISHLFINSTSGENRGLFGALFSGARVQNLSLVNATVVTNSTSFETGILAGSMRDSLIEHVHVDGTIQGANTVGGIVGLMIQGGSIRYSGANVTAQGVSRVGGLVGETRSNTLIFRSYSKGVVNTTGSSGAGGLVGHHGTGGTSQAVISESYSTAAVYAHSWAGGLVGTTQEGAIIEDSWASGNVTRTGTGSLFGGLVGNCFIGIINRTYSTGAIINTTGSDGGFSGNNAENCTVTNSFWNTQTSGFVTSPAGAGKTTAEMQNISTYRDTQTIGLDEAWSLTYDTVTPFTTWIIADGEDYPRLAWTQNDTLPLFVCRVEPNNTCPIDYAHLLGLSHSVGGGHAQLSNPLRRINISFSQDTPNKVAVAQDGSVSVLYPMFARRLSSTGEVLWERADFPINTVAIDDEGNTYYPTGNNLRVFKISPGGAVVWNVLFPGETRAVAPDQEQNAYVVGRDGATQLLYKLNSTGGQEWNVTLNATVTEVAYGGGRVHVAGEGVLWNFNPDGGLEWFYNSTTGTFYRSIAADDEGNTYASSQGYDMIKLNRSGAVVWQTTPGSFFIPRGTLSVDTQQHVFGSTHTGRVVKLNPDGTVQWLFEPENSPGGVIVDEQGRVHVTQGDFLDIYRDFSITPYDNSLCCLSGTTTLTTMCGDTAFFLSQETNAHAQSVSVATYEEPVCLSQPLWNLTCVTREGSCLEEEFCVASLSAQTNAHVAECGLYTYSICCEADRVVPEVPVLLTPEDAENTSLERQPEFTWTSVEFASYYTLNITAPESCSSLAPLNVSTLSYTPPSNLCTGPAYEWTVRACSADDICSDWAEPFTFEIPSVIGIEFVQSTIDFGLLAVSTSEETTEQNTIDDPSDPLRVRNTGNVFIAYDTRALTALWDNEPLDSLYFQFRDQTASTWENMSSTEQRVFTGLPLQAERDLNVRIQVPINEPAGTKTSTIQIIAESSE